MSPVGWIFNFQFFDQLISALCVELSGVTRWKNLGEFRWYDLSKNLEIFFSVSNGAWRLYRWDIHLVQEHLITIALKWRLHWNCFWCSFLGWTFPGECPESSIVPSTTFFSQFTYLWLNWAFFVGYLVKPIQLNNLGYPWMNLLGSY